jgi:hypothetical protein
MAPCPGKRHSVVVAFNNQRRSFAESFIKQKKKVAKSLSILLLGECKIKRVGLQAKNQSHDNLEEKRIMDDRCCSKEPGYKQKINLMISLKKEG